MDNTEVVTQHIEYTRTVVPSSMRSPYWKYFGFPSDNANNVLTRQKIVCTLCNAVIAYNKNTSNLRTHIVARHPELLIELYNEKNKKANDAPPTSNAQNRLTGSEPPLKRQKTLYILDTNEAKGGSILPQSAYISSVNESEASDLKPYNESIIEVNEVIEQSDEKTDNSDYEDYPGSIANAEYTFDEIEDSNIKVAVPLESTANENIEKKLVDMLIIDMQPPSIVENSGFMKLVTTLGIPTSLLQKSHMESLIKKMYDKGFKRIHQQLKTITNTMAYCLSMESFHTIENRTMMCIYFNHLVPSEARLQYTAYTTIEATENTDYASIFSDFNLSNCSAAMIVEENELVEQFFASHGIPVIPCFESVINSCMTTIFSHPVINMAYKKTLELFEKHDCASMLESIPDICEENPWSKYNFLQFVQDHVSIADEENNEVTETCKQLVGFLNPLKITLETIADEPIPLCSLMKPLCRKLTEEYFPTFFCESEVLGDVKTTVTNELTHKILNNLFLSEASFFDPRFQNVTIESENVQDIKESVAQRFEHLLANSTSEEKQIKLETKSTRKSSLKLFFNRGNEQETKPLQKNMKRSLDYEIMKYTAESGVDLEQCPVKWWEENEFIYRKLRKISNYYMCVPCCATNLFKLSLSDRITTVNRRYMLRKNVVNQIWFLNFNRDIIKRIKTKEESKQ